MVSHGDGTPRIGGPHEKTCSNGPVEFKRQRVAESEREESDSAELDVRVRGQVRSFLQFLVSRCPGVPVSWSPGVLRTSLTLHRRSLLGRTKQC